VSDHCLIVLGMHRSGTSCLTGTIEQCGVALGEVFTENPFNRKGNRENAAVQALNNDVLEANGGAWNQPVDVAHWTDKLRARRDNIIHEIRSGADDWWGFKDPRVVLALPFWLEAIDSPRFIGTFRHPHRVALSLNHRDRMPLENAYDLWLAYNHRLLDYQARFGFDLVNFDLRDDEYRADVASKLARLGLTSQADDLFFDPGLRHQSMAPVDGVPLPDDAREVYQRLKARYAAL